MHMQKHLRTIFLILKTTCSAPGWITEWVEVYIDALLRHRGSLVTGNGLNLGRYMGFHFYNAFNFVV